MEYRMHWASDESPKGTRSVPRRGGQVSVAPAFKVQTIAGNEFDFGSVLGRKPAALIFWASWCGPCIDEAPHLARLHRRYASEGIEFLSVSIDEAEDLPSLSKIVDELQLPYPVGLDPKGEVLSLYAQDTAIPLVYLISRDGNVAYTHQNFEAGDEKVLEAHLRSLKQEAQ